MKYVGLIVLNCFATVFGRPGLLIGGGDLGGFQGAGGHGSQNTLIGIPDVHGYAGLVYPNFGLQDLGTIYQGEIPPKVVKINSAVAFKIPKPYPVKVPHNVPFPVPVEKPYPVPVTQLVKVPQPVPVEVIKSVAVPVEVPKPYPVPESEYAAAHGSGGGFSGYGSNNGQFGQFNSQEGYGGADSYSSYNNQEGSNYGQGFEGQDDNSPSYGAIAPADSNQNFESTQNLDQHN
ncbi:uncharacterized protein LOC116169085 [Photinus pyralis]|uniref:uncharacterized protein LOC116169085 n=1 Tax=Photinus pyralis TaxID=7054 RepID=UPI0012674879|nr:uncharacterized protein LOC116169085 [Photinus pyralis]